jgi:hypothetical protein
MNRTHIVVALSAVALCLLPLAACGSAQTTDPQTASGTNRQAAPEPKTKTGGQQATRTEQQTDTEQQTSPDQTNTEQQTDTTTQIDVDPQAIIDSLQVGSDGSSDTMDAVPHGNMYDIWTGCMPQNQVNGVRWVTGPQSEYIRLTASDGQLPTMFDCMASATGMTDDARASITESQDGQWHMTNWDGYQAIWQRSGTSTDVVVQIR